MLAIVGLPCSGKSTIGKRLAKRLKRTFIDLDSTIELRLGCSIQEFFEQHGEERFRDIESEMLDQMSLTADCILSTGGGSILRLENRELLKRRGTVFYLYATPQQLLPRVGSTKKRPLLDVADPLERLDDLFTTRDKLYREAAHHVIVTRGKPPGQVVASIRWHLKMQAETRDELCDRV